MSWPVIEHVSRDGVALMHYFEQCELEAYPDPGSELGAACSARGLPMRDYHKVADWRGMSGDPWTIGWGQTGPDVHQGLIINQDEADAMFAATLEKFEEDVRSLVKVPIMQYEFDALVSFAYNVGSDIDPDDVAEGLGDSTLLKKLNTSHPKLQVAAEFMRWCRAGGREMRGLKRRRFAEWALFLNMPWRLALQEYIASGG